MTHPGWLLVPWAVFALAALLKVWQITALFRRTLRQRQTQSSEAMRAQLERIWHKDSLTPG